MRRICTARGARPVVVGLVLAAVCGAALARGSLQAQARLHYLFLTVTDSAGAPAGAVAASEVSIKEDGAECKVIGVEPINWPISLTVLVDNGTKSSDLLGNLRAGLSNFLSALPDGIEISLLTMAPQPRWIVRPTTDRQLARKGVDLIAPDSAGAQFFDALLEAGSRIEKDKTNHFPVIMMVTTDVGGGRVAVKDSDFATLQRQVVEHAVTVHVVMVSSGAQSSRVGNVGGTLQTQVGLALTKLSGGRYESLEASTRLVTLLPEIAKDISRSATRQSHEFRVSYEPHGAGQPQQVSASLAKPGFSADLSLDGRWP